MSRAIIIRFNLNDEEKALLTRYARRLGRRVRDLLAECGRNVVIEARDDEREREKRAFRA